MSEQEQQAEQAKVEQVKIEETQAEQAQQAQTAAEEQENPAVEEGDALEEAIARVQELEEQLAETAKKSKIFCYAAVRKWIISAVVPSKMWKKLINLP